MTARADAEHLFENGQLKQCRICLDNDNLVDMISPCLCSGSSAFVHRKCLNYWRSENVGGKGFKFCNVCQFEYIIETVVSDPKAESERLMKYYFFVIRDSIALILLVQLVILGFALILRALDTDGEIIKYQFPDAMREFTGYYLSALILLLAIVGLIAFIIFYCSSNSSDGFDTNRCPNCSRNFFGSSSMNRLFSIVVILLLIFAVIGLFVGIVLAGMALEEVMEHHASQLWLRQEAKKYIVKDFQGRKIELEKYKKSLLFS